jgi:energy-coupling factor transporter ATP-binding protein EcfA2
VEKIIETRGLTHSYSGSLWGSPAIRDISIEIREGEVLALVGQNGAGKTTLAKHFNGLLRPTKGEVYFEGTETRGMTVALLSRKVGYVFQDPDRMLFLNTVEEELSFGPKNLSMSPAEVDLAVEEVASELDLKELFGMSPFLLGRAAKRRLATASVLAMRPRVLVMDEPSVGQDRVHADRLMAYVERLNRSRGLTVVFITHDMRLVAEHAGRALVLSRGELIFDGAPRELFSDEATLRRAGLEPPQITQLTIRMPEHFSRPSLSVDEALGSFSRNPSRR